MPYIESSTYRPPFYFRNGHFQTIHRVFFRKVPGLAFSRERLNTPDGDFIDIDWSKVGGDRVVLVLHGLEGSTNSSYLQGVIRYFNQRGWDGVGLNFRGCSGSPNRALRSYHSGETTDVDFLIREIASRKEYKALVLVGFSLGGNVTLKYVGERADDLPDLLKLAVGVSVPCHLESSSYQLMKGFNQVYLKNFLKDLKDKVRAKEQQYPGALDYQAAYNARNFIEFDDVCTGPVNGFKGAVDYWTKSSSLQFLPHIRIPTLLINSHDDSFLSERCYPKELADSHPHLHLEIPKYGGHVGFGPADQALDYWTDRRIFQFVEQQLGT